MVDPSTRQGCQALRKRLVALVGHTGATTPPTTTAAQHLRETTVAKNTDPTKFSGQPLANAGRSIIELLWEEMDSVYARLMAGDGARAKGDKGRAAGLAHALALMTNPYAVNVEAIREAAHERWEAGTDELDESNYAAG